MDRDDRVYLRHILDAIGRIERYLSGVSYDQFLANDLLQDGVIRQLMIVGEAAGDVSDALQDAHPEIPWGKMTGIRNRLVHVYRDVDLSIVWDTARADLPGLTQQIEELLG